MEQVKKRKRIFRKVFIGLLVVFLLLQFYRPSKNLGTGQAANDIFHTVRTPDSVQRLLVTACYDCHSNHTNYPWYSEVAPANIWLANHINDGKKELNFTEFGSLPIRRQRSKLSAVAKQVEKKEMPLQSYTMIHRNAELSDQQRQMIIAWTDSARAEVSARQ